MPRYPVSGGPIWAAAEVDVRLSQARNESQLGDSSQPALKDIGAAIDFPPAMSLFPFSWAAQ